MNVFISSWVRSKCTELTRHYCDWLTLVLSLGFHIRKKPHLPSHFLLDTYMLTPVGSLFWVLVILSYSTVAQNISKMEVVDPGSKSSVEFEMLTPAPTSNSDPFAAFFKAVQTYGSFLPDVSWPYLLKNLFQILCVIKPNEKNVCFKIWDIRKWIDDSILAWNS